MPKGHADLSRVEAFAVNYEDVLMEKKRAVLNLLSQAESNILDKKVVVQKILDFMNEITEQEKIIQELDAKRKTYADQRNEYDKAAVHAVSLFQTVGASWSSSTRCTASLYNGTWKFSKPR